MLLSPFLIYNSLFLERGFKIILFFLKIKEEKTVLVIIQDSFLTFYFSKNKALENTNIALENSNIALENSNITLENATKKKLFFLKEII